MYRTFRSNLAEVLNVPEGALNAQSLTRYFRDHSPLGTNTVMTYMAALTGELYRAVESRDSARVQALVVAQAMFIDQTCVNGGAMKQAWLLTGLEPPPFQTVRPHTANPSGAPISALCDPRWLSATLDFMRDLEYFEKHSRGGPEKAPPKPPDPKTRATRPKGPKAPPKGGGG